MQKKYRPCAGAVVFNKDGLVLLGARIESEGDDWQFPQGGIEIGETPIQAAKRELFEEMNVSSVNLVHIYEKPLRYDFPNNVKEKFKKKGTYFDGQEIYFGLFFFCGDDEEISTQTKYPEFKKYDWKDMNFALSHVIDFKKDIYISLTKKFNPLIEQYLKKAS